MSDLDQVLRLWQHLEVSGEDCVLATIVRVDGSSYRKPGARMLITEGGLRAGTISGGCLEAEVSKQAWWLTEKGSVVRQYATTFEADGDRPYGLGCGGTVHLLLERRASVEPFLRALQSVFAARQALACAVALEGAQIGQRCIVAADDTTPSLGSAGLFAAAREAWLDRESFLDGDSVWSEYIPPRCGLFVFGAGDDAKPLVTQARTLGWYIVVADGRAHLATRLRFPEADEVRVLRHGEESFSDLGLLESDAAVVMTHSYQQDVSILQQLLPLRLAYLGVLGPRYRTADLLKDVAQEMGGSASRWMDAIHAPVGFDLGGDSPATIALSILAEIQGTLSQRRAQRPIQNGNGTSQIQLSALS